MLSVLFKSWSFRAIRDRVMPGLVTAGNAWHLGLGTGSGQRSVSVYGLAFLVYPNPPELNGGS